MGNALKKMGAFSGKSAAVSFEEALNDSFQQQQLLVSEVEKLNQKLVVLQDQAAQYETYGREQQKEADEARREVRRLGDFIAEQQSRGYFVDQEEASVRCLTISATCSAISCRLCCHSFSNHFFLSSHL